MCYIIFPTNQSFARRSFWFKKQTVSRLVDNRCMRRHGHWSDHLTAAHGTGRNRIGASARNFEGGKKKETKSSRGTLHRSRDRAPRCAWHLPGTRVKAARARTFAIVVRCIRPVENGRQVRERGRENEEETMRFLPVPGRVTGRRAVRPVPASLSSLLPLPGPPTVPRPRWECPKKPRRILRKFRGGSFSLSPLFPATRRRTMCLNDIERYGTGRFCRTVLCDARYSLVVYHG